MTERTRSKLNTTLLSLIFLLLSLLTTGVGYLIVYTMNRLDAEEAVNKAQDIKQYDTESAVYNIIKEIEKDNEWQKNVEETLGIWSSRTRGGTMPDMNKWTIKN